MSKSTFSHSDDEDGKSNAKVHTDNKPDFKKRPEAYPATRDGGDTIDKPDKAKR